MRKELRTDTVYYTNSRAHEKEYYIGCSLMIEKKKKKENKKKKKKKVRRRKKKKIRERETTKK